MKQFGLNLLRTARILLAVAMFSNLHSARADITTGLALWWRLNEAQGTAIKDSSGNHFNTGSSQPSWTLQPRVGLTFPAAGTPGITQGALSSGGAATIAFWARFDSSNLVTGNYFRYILRATNPTAGHSSWSIYISYGALRFNLDNQVEYSYPMPNDGLWHHFAFRCPPFAATVYVDGVQVASGAGRGGQDIQTISLGHAPNVSIVDFVGDLNDVRFYNRALDVTDIAQLVAQPLGVNGLQTKWNFDLQDFTDVSGTGNLGLPSGSAIFKAAIQGYSLALDGIHDYVTATPYRVYPKVSAMCFVRFDRLDECAVIDAWGTRENFKLHLVPVGTGYRFSASFHDFEIGSKLFQPVSVTGSTSVLPNTLYHVATTYDGQRLRLYVNGLLEGYADTDKTTWQADTAASYTVVRLGASAASDRFLAGTVDEFRLYDRAVTDAEVQSFYHEPFPYQVSGQTSYMGPRTGRIRVSLIGQFSSYSFAQEASGAFSFDFLRSNESYTLAATMDADGDGVYSGWDPSVTLSGSPLVLTQSYSNLSLSIQDRISTLNDGVADNWKTAYGLSLSDSTLASKHPLGDGLTYLQKFMFGLNPLITDTDGDGISDYDELFVYHANPLLADTDGDGMPDKWEIDHGLNPRVNDANDDADMDGLTNLQEYLAGTDPQNRYSVAGNAASDYERVTGKRQSWNGYDPNNRLLSTQYSNGMALVYLYDGNGNITRQKMLSEPDFDHDGLPDAWELAYGLNPNSAAGDDGPFGDPDNDGWTNYQEWKAGTNPRDANSHPDLLTTPAAQLRQTPTLARLLPASSTLGALPTLNLKLWDGEGNSAKVALQYFDTGSGQWKDATLTKLDGGTYNAATAVAALPGGTAHTLMWNAWQDLGSSFNGSALLRVRADDFASTGAWSEPVSVAVNMGVDTNGDGVPDRWAMQYGLDPNGASAAQTDTDRDGLSDFLEYALNTHPRLASPAGQPVTSIEGGYLTLTVTRNPAATALQFHIAVSADLATWFSDAAHVTILQDTPTLLKARDNIPITAAPNRYIRLEVTKP